MIPKSDLYDFMQQNKHGDITQNESGGYDFVPVDVDDSILPKKPEWFGHQPEDAAKMGTSFTNTPIDPQYADSGQVYTDVRPPSNSQPSPEEMDYMDKLTNIRKHFSEKLAKAYGEDYTNADINYKAQQAMERYLYNNRPAFGTIQDVDPKHFKIAQGIYQSTLAEEGQKQNAFMSELNKYETAFNSQYKAAPKIKGFDPETNQPVYEDKATGRLLYGNGMEYSGGPLEPVTEGSQATVLRKTTKPDDMEKLADAIEQGKNTIGNVAKGMGGAHTAREVSKVLQKRGVDVTQIDLNIASKRSAQNALEKTVNQLKPFEETAKRNLDYANMLSKKYVRSKYPALNKIVMTWDQQTGDPEIEKFKIATYDGMAEAMKHMMAGSGITAAELTVGAQEQAKKLLNAIQNWQQFDAVIEAINVGLRNRSQAYRERLQYVKEQPVTKFDPEKQEEDFERKMQLEGRRDIDKILFGDNKPPRDQYFADLKKANPTASEKEINDYLDKKGIR